MKKQIENIKNKLIGMELMARQGKENFAQLELRCFSIRQELESLHTPASPSGVTHPVRAAKNLLRKAGKITTIHA